jgi:hypothetical protein
LIFLSLPLAAKRISVSLEQFLKAEAKISSTDAGISIRVSDAHP